MPDRKNSFIVLLFFISLVLLQYGQAFSQDAFVYNSKPILQVHRAAGQIKIDGNFEDAGWKGAAIARNFAEHSPGDRIKPPVETEVLVTYDDDNFYLGFLCADDPRTVRASLRDRDEIFEDDCVGMFLDTYGDASWAYEILVNPLGCQGDLRMTSSGNEDPLFDIVFQSRGRVTDKGFQVEVAIPFASLRFPSKGVQEWKATFWRNRPRSSMERFSWAAINRDDPCVMCEWGMLKGIENVKPGRRFELLPSLTAHQATYLNDEGSLRSGYQDEKVKAKASVNLRYLLASDLTADVTYNPDFSQVESDETQIQVNNPFALSFPEKRPFFQEGSDLFSTYINAVYTRSINDPLVAAKLTGRINRTAIGYIGARDRKTPIILPLEESSVEFGAGESYSNVMRLKQTVLEDSYLGLLMTDRRLDRGGSGSIVGGDGSLRFLKNYRFNFGVIASHTEEPNDTALTRNIYPVTFERGRHTSTFDGESFWGRAVHLAVAREARTWNANVNYGEISPTFRVDNGYIERNDRRTVEFWSGLFFRPNAKLIDEVTPSVDVARVWNFAGWRKDEWLMPELSVLFKRQTLVSISYLWSRETYRNLYFPGIRRYGLGIESSFSEPVSLSFEYTHGRIIARLVDPPVLGKGTEIGIGATLKFWQRLVIRPTLSYSKLDYPNDSNIYSGYVTRTRINYQFNREWFLRLIVEYDDFNKSFSVEPLLSYKLNPFTIFYLGSGHDFRQPNNDTVWLKTGQQYFVKLQYLLRV